MGHVTLVGSDVAASRPSRPPSCRFPLAARRRLHNRTPVVPATIIGIAGCVGWSQLFTVTTSLHHQTFDRRPH